MALTRSERFKLKGGIRDEMQRDDQAWDFTKQNMLLREFSLQTMSGYNNGPDFEDLVADLPDRELVEMCPIVTGIEQSEVRDVVEAADAGNWEPGYVKPVHLPIGSAQGVHGQGGGRTRRCRHPRLHRSRHHAGQQALAGPDRASAPVDGRIRRDRASRVQQERLVPSGGVCRPSLQIFSFPFDGTDCDIASDPTWSLPELPMSWDQPPTVDAASTS